MTSRPHSRTTDLGTFPKARSNAAINADIAAAHVDAVVTNAWITAVVCMALVAVLAVVWSTRMVPHSIEQIKLSQEEVTWRK